MPCKRLKKGSVEGCVVRSKKESVNQISFSFSFLTIHNKFYNLRCIYVYVCKEFIAHKKRNSYVIFKHNYFSNIILFKFIHLKIIAFAIITN